MRNILFLLFTAFSYMANSQAKLPEKISVGDGNSVYIVFDSEITTVDIGSNDFIQHIPSNNKDMIFIKASFKDAPGTSLMVRTLNDVYVTNLEYAEQPEQPLYDLRVRRRTPRPQELESASTELPSSNVTTDPDMPEVIKSRVEGDNRDHQLDNPDVKEKVWKMIDNTQLDYTLYGDVQNNMTFMISNLYVDSKYMYVKLKVLNESSLPFNVDFISFELNESAKLKKNSAVQNKLLDVKYYESIKTSKPSTNEDMVFVFDIYAFENKDKFKIRMNEIDGERALEFWIPGKEVAKAERF